MIGEPEIRRRLWVGVVESSAGLAILPLGLLVRGEGSVAPVNDVSTFLRVENLKHVLTEQGLISGTQYIIGVDIIPYP